MPCTGQIARHRWAVVDHFAKDQSAIFFQSNSLTDVTAVVAAAQKIHLLVANTIITGLQIWCSVGQACLEIQMDRHLSLLARISVTWGQCIQICTLASLLLNSIRLVKIYMMIKCCILNIQLYISMTTYKCFLSEWSCKFLRLAVSGTLIQSKEV